jgi:TonB-linked SusC/RagA family outer membrane protein
MVFFAPHNIFAQEQKLKIESVVSDEQGKPVMNAKIFSGSSYAKTDENGRFTLLAVPGSRAIVEANGFESITVSIDEIKDNGGIKLKKDLSPYGADQKVDLGFRKTNERDVVGFVQDLNINEIYNYDHNIWARDVLAGRVLGMQGGDRIRGIGRGIGIDYLTGNSYSGTPVVVVDGLPRDVPLRMSEVESITVLKDVNSAVLYGSDAINGVISITTKRGEAFKKVAEFTANYGMSTPLELPEYLNSADYMTYYNQARANDNLSEQFSAETIQNYKSGNKYRYPDVDYYSNEYLRSFKNYFDLNGAFSGGNDVAKYYANLGWNSAGSILNFGEGSKARNNIFNVRGNVDLKINDWIKTQVDVSGFFLDDKGQRGNYWSDASTIRPYEYTPLLPIDLIDPANEVLLARKNDVNGQYLLGGNSNHLTTPFGDGYSGGVLERIWRNFSFNNRIDFALDKLTKGLSFHTNISFDYRAGYDQTVANGYSVYEPTWSPDGDSIIALKQYGKDSHSGTQSVGNTYFQRRFGAFGLLSYDRTFNGLHHFTGSVLGYFNNFKKEGDFQGMKQAHLGLQLGYVYNNRYMIDFSGAYVNSTKLAPGHRAALSPSLGLAWIISSEDFMASASKIDYLKLKASAGVMNSDFPIGGFYYYDNSYTTSGSYSWYEGGRSRSGVMSRWENNPNLGFVKRNEINFGIDGLFFNKLLGAEINLFYDNYNNLVVRPGTQYPGYYSDFISYENFGANEYKGAEIGLSLNKSFGDWSVFIAGNFLYSNSVRTKVDEVYNNPYQYRKGHPADANFGLEAIGLFSDIADIDKSPVQAFGAVQPGDIKYKDQNNDGIIDGNDEVYIGRYQAPYSGGLQIKVSYRNLTFFALGEGSSGAVDFKSGNYYWVDGNKKYSEVVLGAWTPATKSTATYPRLSSQTNSNNNQTSTYWMYDDNYFQIRKIQLTYNMPSSVMKALLVKRLAVFVDASNIIEFSKTRKIRDLRIGGEPNYRIFSIGVNASL